jgi:hypothetical protein
MTLLRERFRTILFLPLYPTRNDDQRSTPPMILTRPIVRGALRYEEMLFIKKRACEIG